MITVKFDEPFEYGGETITELKIRKPVARDLYYLEDFERPMMMMSSLLVTLSERPSELIDNMPTAAFFQCTGVLEGFLGQAKKA